MDASLAYRLSDGVAAGPAFLSNGACFQHTSHAQSIKK